MGEVAVVDVDDADVVFERASTLRLLATGVCAGVGGAGADGELFVDLLNVTAEESGTFLAACNDALVVRLQLIDDGILLDV